MIPSMRGSLVICFAGFRDYLALSRLIAALTDACRARGCVFLPAVVENLLAPLAGEVVILDGVPNPDHLDRLRALGAKRIIRAPWMKDSPVRLPLVAFDEEAYGRLGAQHLAERVEGELWYIGRGGRWWSRLRAAGFAKVCAERRRACQVAEIAEAIDYQTAGKLFPGLTRVLQDIPLGGGLMCANDHVACNALRILRGLGRDIPRDLQVLSVDDDVPAFAGAFSSIRHPWPALGECLANLLLDERPAVRTLIAPRDVAMRATTVSPGSQVLAMQFIDLCRRGAEPSIAHMLLRLGCSRRYLEMATMRHVGQTPAAILRSFRLTQARTHLAAGGTRMEAMRLAGFVSRASFNRAMRRQG